MRSFERRFECGDSGGCNSVDSVLFFGLIFVCEADHKFIITVSCVAIHSGIECFLLHCLKRRLMIGFGVELVALVEMV